MRARLILEISSAHPAALGWLYQELSRLKVMFNVEAQYDTMISQSIHIASKIEIIINDPVTELKLVMKLIQGYKEEAKKDNQRARELEEEKDRQYRDNMKPCERAGVNCKHQRGWSDDPDAIFCEKFREWLWTEEEIQHAVSRCLRCRDEDYEPEY